MKQARYVLCRPGGGLADNLGRIVACYQYAKRFNRTLIIDTQIQSAVGFLCRFDHYFTILHQRAEVEILVFDKAIEAALEKMTLYPLALNLEVKNKKAKEWVFRYPTLFLLLDKLYRLFTQSKEGFFLKNKTQKLTYKEIYNQEKRNYIEVQSGTQLAFNLEEDYHYPVLVHHQCGGAGTNELALLLSILRFAPRLSQFITERMATLTLTKEPYDAIQVRHTDYRGDYQEFFLSIKDQVEGKKLLICSDNQEVIDHAKQAFSKSTVFTTGASASTNNKPLHYQKEALASEGSKSLFELNAEGFLDLYALSGAETLHLSPVKRNGVIFPSGYQRMAKLLHSNQALRGPCLSNYLLSQVFLPKLFIGLIMSLNAAAKGGR